MLSSLHFLIIPIKGEPLLIAPAKFLSVRNLPLDQPKTEPLQNLNHSFFMIRKQWTNEQQTSVDTGSTGDGSHVAL